jgi:RNA polymerase sigma factor (sigma-70 family)
MHEGEPVERRLSVTMTVVALRFPMESSSKQSIDWAQALESHRSWLSTVVRARLADRQAAEDVMQEVALAAIAQPSRPTDPSKVAPWLYRIALRKVINHHRATGRRRRLLDGAIASGRARAHTVEIGPGEWLMKEECLANVASVLKMLSPQDRQILLLKYTEGWGYQELSEHLGISIKTVEYRLLKARKSLRARIAQE